MEADFLCCPAGAGNCRSQAAFEDLFGIPAAVKYGSRQFVAVSGNMTSALTTLCPRPDCSFPHRRLDKGKA